MTILPFFAAVVVVQLFSSLTVAEIKSLTISNDSRPIILLEKFGIIEIGHVTVSVSSVSVSSPSSSPVPDSSKLGFFVLSEESLPEVLLELQKNFSFCVLDSHYILYFFTFIDLSPPPRSQFNRSYPITSPNDYSLFFANCVPETRVSMNVRAEIYHNLDPDGSRDYLLAGSTQLPGLYLVFSLCYLSFLCFWFCFCWNNMQIVKRIHLLMTVLLLVKSLTLICAAMYKHYVKVTGTAHGWNIVFYIFHFISVVLLFMVIVLVGNGWCFLKPKLHGKEKKLLMIVVPLQVLANIASIVIGETGPYTQDWVIWNQIFLLADVTSCCAIVFAMVWSMCCLRETSKTDGKAVKNLAKLPVFRNFNVLVIGYLFFTRIVVVVMKMEADFRYQWVSNASEEIATLAFYSLMFYIFRPMEKNEYFDVDDEEETAELSSRNKSLGSETI
ncbi:Lung seven transmembrane receptor-like [Arabidopsis suecica]|uniref:Lung seven transmembrane receptor-like n=1 Tax=Arabidopsis suecica TaxID=45249 RepID=A0A8T1Z477_ARASU|nr:Lung seven transmembrane receptor-like [Arabidopsis suecica]